MAKQKTVKTGEVQFYYSCSEKFYIGCIIASTVVMLITMLRYVSSVARDIRQSNCNAAIKSFKQCNTVVVFSAILRPY